MMNAIKKFGIVALVLTALTGMIPITAKAAGDNGSALQILTPVEGAGYWHVPGNVLHNFEVTITDAIGELNDGTYTVWWDNNGSGMFAAVSGLKVDAKGRLIVPRKYVTAMTYNSQFYVENESGARSEVRHVTVQVDPPMTISATLDKGEVNYKEGDTARVTFDFSNTFQESSQPGYIFLVPLDEATSNLVEITSQSEAYHTTSVSVYPGMFWANTSASIRLKDGYDGCLLNFGIELRSDNDNTQDNIIAVWEGKSFTIGVDNVAPSVSYIAMNDTPLKTNGGTFVGAVPAGVQKTFSLGITDPAFELDFADGNVAYTQITFWENGSVVDIRLIKGIPVGKSVAYTFQNAGTARVSAKVRDKDMSDQEFDAAPEFTANITVVDPPAITLVPYGGSNLFLESELGIVQGRIDVELTVPPSGLGVGEEITVVLEVYRNGLNDGPLPVLNKYEVPFRNGQTTGFVYFNELDGTPQSELKGFRIMAYVKEKTVCPMDETKTWRQYYQPDDLDIFVINSSPQIGPGSAVSTNERPASIYVPFKITWNVKDAVSDQQSMQVTWTYNGSSQTTTQSTTGTYLKEIVFTSAGSKVVTLTVKDKDGDTDTRSWYFYVEPSMELDIIPRRPNTGALSRFSLMYTQAAGIGAGRVWSTFANSPTRVSNFTQSWYFQPANDLCPMIYAYGYKVGDIDNGGLGPAGSWDHPLDAAGTWYREVDKYGSFYTYQNPDDKDSFFYCWLLFDREEGNSIHLNGVVQPQIGDGTGGNVVEMPEYDEEALSYPSTKVEGIFSLEYLREDNVGDINQDGIPDVFAASTVWGSGQLYKFAGFELGNGGDLECVDSHNGDEDFLPASTAQGGVHVATESHWASAGGAFTAYREIRGFGDGLNFRQDDDGLNRNVRGNWISEPVFTPAESNAIARVNGLTLPDPEAEDYEAQVTAWKDGLMAADSWIPENRTDPTVEDTDGDGFSDGYEYWFWYSAMVGEMDAEGNIQRLSGLRLTSDGPSTEEVITPEEVAEAFNPTVAALALADRDTDNDGLTDLEEYALGTSPINWDTDGDGLSDFFYANHRDPVTDQVNGYAWAYVVEHGGACILGFWEDETSTGPAETINIPFELGGFRVTTLTSGSFACCRGLTSVTIPDGVTTIGDYAFVYCGGLASMAIPKSVTEIGEYAFYGCNALQVVYVDVGDAERVSGLYSWPSGVSFVESASPSISGDLEATVSGDPANGFVVRPSDEMTTVEVLIPQGVDAAKVTVEVSPLVASVKANGAKMKVVSDNADITAFLDIPPAVDGIVDLARASVKAAIVEEVLDTEKGAVIELDPSNPVLTTVNTRKGLVYQLREGVTLDTMHDGASIIGNGQPWTPPITVKGGNSAFYSIHVGK